MVKWFSRYRFIPFFFILIVYSCNEVADLIPDPQPVNDFRGEIISSELLAHYSAVELRMLFTSIDTTLLEYPITYDIDVYKVIYKTIDANNIETQASGAVILPCDTTIDYPLISYQHETVLLKDDVPSRMNDDIYLGMMYSCAGYVMAMPDYLGLGDSPGLHPYCNSKTEASAAIDLLIAAKKLCSELSIQLNEQLFLFGYSQGGHATMAATKELQTNYKDMFNITLSAPMSGPYELSGAEMDVLMQDEKFEAQYFLPYLLFAYNDIYHLWNDPSEYFVAPYDSILPPLFDGMHTSADINHAMPSIPKEILQPEVIGWLTDKTQCPLMKAIQDNDLVNWRPVIPMNMYYCSSDELVAAKNTTDAYDQFIFNGSTAVTEINASSESDHYECGEPCLILTRAAFDALKQ